MGHTEKVTKRLSKHIEYTACCYCCVFLFDSKEVLQAYQGYFYDSTPIYSEILECGTRREIPKDEFRKRLDEYFAA